MSSPNVASMYKWSNNFFSGAVNGSQDFLQLIRESDGTVLGWIDENGVAQGSLFPVIPIAPTVANIVITNSQLLNMHTTPVVLVPSPGPGKYISPQTFSFALNVGTVPFQISGNGNGSTYVYWLNLGTGNDGQFAPILIADNANADGMDYTNVGSQLYLAEPFIEGPSVAFSSIINSPLVISMDDALSVGNGDMLVTFSYTIVTV